MQKNTHTIDIDIEFYSRIRRTLSDIVELSNHVLTIETDKKIQSWARYMVESALSILNALNEKWQTAKSHHNHLKFIDFYALLDGIKIHYQPLPLEKNIKFSFENRIHWIFSDTDKIRCILSELLSNAFQFTDQGSVILTTLIKKNNLVLNIHDTGKGFYEPYKHAQTQGSGLKTVQKILNDLGGHLHILSEPKKGSSVVCTLPLFRKPDLLLIEDSPVMLLMAQVEFEKKGFNVITADTIKKAWGKINHQPYALIVTDMDLPDGRGDMLAEKIRHGNSPCQKIPLVALTSHDSDKIHGKENFDEIFQKPLTPEKADAITKMEKIVMVS